MVLIGILMMSTLFLVYSSKIHKSNNTIKNRKVVAKEKLLKERSKKIKEKEGYNKN